MRSVVLARSLAARDPGVRAVILTAASLPDERLLGDARESAMVISADATDDSILASLSEAGATAARSAIVFDTLGAPPSLVTRLRRAGYIVITLDDPGAGAAAADISVNALVPGQATYSGYDYLVLPHQAPPSGAARAKGTEDLRIFTSFGGNDEHAILPTLLRPLLPVAAERGWQVDAVAAYPDGVIDSARKLIEKTPEYAHLHRNPPDYLDLLRRADIALVSGGLTLFTALQLGVPAIVVAQYPHQRDSAGVCQRAGAALSLGLWSDIKPADVVATIVALAADAGRRAEMSRSASALIDGNGMRRLIDIILGAMGRLATC